MIIFLFHAAVYFMFVKPETVTICEQTVKKVSCDKGFINIYSIAFGPKTKCPYLLRGSDCRIDIGAATRIKQRCNGKTACDIDDEKESYTSYCAKIPNKDRKCDVSDTSIGICLNESEEKNVCQYTEEMFLRKYISIQYSCNDTAEYTVPIYNEENEIRLEVGRCNSQVIRGARIVPKTTHCDDTHVDHNCIEKLKPITERIESSLSQCRDLAKCNPLFDAIREIKRVEENCMWNIRQMSVTCSISRSNYTNSLDMTRCQKNVTLQNCERVAEIVKICKNGESCENYCIRHYLEVDFVCEDYTSTTSKSSPSSSTSTTTIPSSTTVPSTTITTAKTSTILSTLEKQTTQDQYASTNNQEDDQYQQTSNRYVLGIGAGLGVAVVVILVLTILLIYLMRRSKALSKSGRNLQGFENSQNNTHDIGNQNIALSLHEGTSEYALLGTRAISQNYEELTSEHDVNTSYDYILETHEDVFKSNMNEAMSTLKDNQYCELIPVSTNLESMNTLAFGNDNLHNHNTIDSTKRAVQRVIMETTDNTIQNSTLPHKSVNECSDPYVILDPQVTGFNRAETMNDQTAEPYAILDPNVTGFDRSKSDRHLQNKHAKSIDE